MQQKQGPGPKEHAVSCQQPSALLRGLNEAILGVLSRMYKGAERLHSDATLAQMISWRFAGHNSAKTQTWNTAMRYNGKAAEVRAIIAFKHKNTDHFETAAVLCLVVSLAPA